MARSINRFFSPRLQPQFTPQFVEEPYPFKEAFMVGAGQQQRINESLMQEQALRDIETRPIEEDIAQRDEILGGLRTEIEGILSKKGGDPGTAALDISKAVGRVKSDPFFTRNTAALEMAEQGRDIQEKIMGRGEVPLAGERYSRKDNGTW